MAPKPSKRAAKSGGTNTAKKVKGPPEPFESAPDAMVPFLSLLNPEYVYITHVDDHPTFFKKQIFAVPVIMNLSIAIGLLYRLYVQLPWYWSLLLTVWGYETSTTVDKSKHTTKELVWIMLGRSAHFMIDFLLMRFIVPWPVSFFTEDGGNPTEWRLAIGFKDKEIYVRRSRSFKAKDILEAETQGRENPFFKVRIIPAVDTKIVRDKTGYATMGSDYDLDFGVMVAAERLIEKKTCPRVLFERTVWIHCGETHGWCRWDVDGEEAEIDDEEFLMSLAREAAKERGE
ncbi:hypothetical protein EJ05DRAFT_247458 [Pseudovirgaria hyperparasitica]|uniref:Uncharacterized protein n=1 Tax=Pseudovirgaria hyperparasitica TaxID=470096 RepID=A0A6A6WDN8_9PEZI|nr:uncharacterized protein EJ05DRAFT_247458 [Pseudovirgaria hyperparasitica]KAF2760942.1 hypothetical protein EJ05DRAFT_247458 [Pseudovirgaria hyperparasitica]